MNLTMDDKTKLELTENAVKVLEKRYLKRDKDGNQEQREQLESLAQMVDEIRSGPYCVSLKQLAVSGADLIASGKKQGVGLGETLEYLLEQVLEHPEWNEKEILLSMVEKNGDSAE